MKPAARELPLLDLRGRFLGRPHPVLPRKRDTGYHGEGRQRFQRAETLCSHGGKERGVLHQAQVERLVAENGFRDGETVSFPIRGAQVPGEVVGRREAGHRLHRLGAEPETAGTPAGLFFHSNEQCRPLGRRSLLHVQWPGYHGEIHRRSEKRVRSGSPEPRGLQGQLGKIPDPPARDAAGAAVSQILFRGGKCGPAERCHKSEAAGFREGYQEVQESEGRKETDSVAGHIHAPETDLLRSREDRPDRKANLLQMRFGLRIQRPFRTRAECHPELGSPRSLAPRTLPLPGRPLPSG